MDQFIDITRKHECEAFLTFPLDGFHPRYGREIPDIFTCEQYPDFFQLFIPECGNFIRPDDPAVPDDGNLAAD